MSYKKYTWAKGDEITSARLNNMEDGVEAAAAAADKVQIEVLPEQTIAGFAQNGDKSATNATDLFRVPLIVGETYAIRWDGQEYICQCVDKVEGGGIVFNGTLIGNGYNAIDDKKIDTGEPFLFMGGLIWTKETGDSHKVGVRLAPPVNVEQIKATDDDEGKILSVVDGKPAWVAIAQAETTSF